MAHMEIPIGNTKNPIEIIPISIMIPMMVRTCFLLSWLLLFGVECIWIICDSKSTNYCLESDFYPFFIYLHYLKSGWMAGVLTPGQHRKCMSRIRSRNTKPSVRMST